MYMFRISDMDKSLQTDELKVKVLDIIKNVVYKQWRHYNPHCAGGNPSDEDLDELVYSIFCEFMTPKSRSGNDKKSMLDHYDPKFDYKGVPDDHHLAAFIKSCVVRKLIDKERHDSKFGTVNYSTNAGDDDNANVDMDYLAQNSGEAQAQDLNSVAEEDAPDYDNFTFDADMIGTMRDNWDEFSDEKKQEIKDIFNKNKKNLPQSFIDAFTDLFNDGSQASPKSSSEFPSAPGTVTKCKVAGKPALKVSFPSKDERMAADMTQFNSEAKAQGYSFYVNRGANAYYVKQ